MNDQSLDALVASLGREDVSDASYTSFAKYREEAYESVLKEITKDSATATLMSNGLLVLYDLCKQACPDKKNHLALQLPDLLQHHNSVVRSSAARVANALIRMSKLYPSMYEIEDDVQEALTVGIERSIELGVDSDTRALVTRKQL